MYFSQNALFMVLAAAFWGCTNPLLKQGGSGVERVTASSLLGQIAAELRYTLLNWKVVLPFLLNQSGSLAYYYLLGTAEISMAVPICSSLTFVFTAATSWALGERVHNPAQTGLGAALVLVGVAICVASKT